VAIDASATHDRHLQVVGWIELETLARKADLAPELVEVGIEERVLAITSGDFERTERPLHACEDLVELDAIALAGKVGLQQHAPELAGLTEQRVHGVGDDRAARGARWIGDALRLW